MHSSYLRRSIAGVPRAARDAPRSTGRFGDGLAATTIMSSRSKLRIRGGPFDGCSISLVGRITTMGRDSTDDIVVEHRVVSRKNGTFVDMQRIGQQPRSLKNGERIQLGSTAIGAV